MTSGPICQHCDARLTMDQFRAQGEFCNTCHAEHVLFENCRNAAIRAERESAHRFLLENGYPELAQEIADGVHEPIDQRYLHGGKLFCKARSVVSRRAED